MRFLAQDFSLGVRLDFYDGSVLSPDMEFVDGDPILDLAFGSDDRSPWFCSQDRVDIKRL